MEKNRKTIHRTILLMLIASVAIWNFFDYAVASAEPTESDLNSDVKKTEKQLSQERAELNASQATYSKVTAQVGVTKSLVSQTATEISRKEAEIKNLNDQVVLYKKLLTVYLQEMYFGSSEENLVKLSLLNGEMDDVFSISDQNLNIKEKILGVMAEVSSSQNQLGVMTEELAEKKKEHEKKLQQKKIEQGAIASDIQESQATIAELQNKLDSLRSALSSFLGGSYDAKDIDDAVKFASKAAGIRKEFLQAELIVETGYGTFTGGCTYKNIRMKEADKSQFLLLAAELEKAYGGSYKSKKLSCSPGFGYGGAMGVAQFMPTTWIGYKTKISSKTGHTPPDPWNLTDGVLGMAIKLAAGGATSRSGEVLASKRYYCGGPSSSYWNNKCDDYAKKVQYFSKDPESHI